MTSATELLSAAGFDNADSIVKAAADSGLPLGVAVALIAKESMGANVYGHDVGGYRPGDVVTQANFAQFYQVVVVDKNTSNGVGPCQITYPGYFSQNPTYAWWDPYSNMLFGFNLLKGYLNGVYTDSALVAAGSTYNSGSETGSASTYGRTFADLAEKWTQQLSQKVDDIVATIDDLKNLLVNDVDVRRAIAVAIWGGGGAASPMYPVRGADPERSEYPETALFSANQRVQQMISASQDAIINAINKINTGNSVDPTTVENAVKDALSVALGNISTNLKG